MSQANPKILISLLLQVGIAVDAATVSQWSDEQQEQIEDWAIRKSMHAKSPSMFVPDMPDVLQPYGRHAA